MVKAELSGYYVKVITTLKHNKMLQYKDLTDGSWRPVSANPQQKYKVVGNDLYIINDASVFVGVFLWGNGESSGQGITIIRGKDNWKVS